MRMWARLLISALIGLIAFGSPSSANADQDPPNAHCQDGVCVITGTGSPSRGTGSGPVSTRVCEWRGRVVPCEGAAGTFSSSDGCYHRVVDPRTVTGPVRAEYHANGGSIEHVGSCFSNSPGGYVWVAPAKPVVTAALVRAQAVRLIPTATIGVAPRTSTLVNIQTILWVDAPGAQNLAAVQILGQRVLIHLSADHVAYDFGDTTTDTHATAGKPYDNTHAPCRTRTCPGYYGHVFTTTGRRTITATAYWHATYTVDGGATHQIPGTVPGPPSTATITVHEARTVLVPNP